VAFNRALYARRRRRSAITMGLSVAATLFGLGWLVLILGVLLWNGFSGLSLKVFTEMTPPPGADGGLLNPIVGSLILTVLAVLIGTPIGMLAGTYMAEYGRYDKLSSVVRFINDILLSAPSIVVGLFIYEVLVAPMGHFSGIAGAVALAVIVIPVVVRTTEDMLTLVPDTLREAAASIGLPRAFMITRIAYRAAKAGLVTGVLLAVARISGETAPLLFTALNNQFESFNLNAPMASLPVVIFQFALSPYSDWQKLAWTGALIITLAVLALSIVARVLSAQRKMS
jgi:phosphate transport system permease protein